MAQTPWQDLLVYDQLVRVQQSDPEIQPDMVDVFEARSSPFRLRPPVCGVVENGALPVSHSPHRLYDGVSTLVSTKPGHPHSVPASATDAVSAAAAIEPTQPCHPERGSLTTG